MILKILLKIWPALTVILGYLFWVFVIEKFILKRLRKSGIIEGEFEEVNANKKPFSLQNKRFILVIYLSLIALIISFLFMAIRVPQIEKGNYVPSQIKDGKVVPAKIITNSPQ